MTQARRSAKWAFLIQDIQADSDRIGPPSSYLAPAASRAGAFLAPPQSARKPGHSASMTTSELIIQLLKIVLGIVFGAYFLWWSLEVLHRLPN